MNSVWQYSTVHNSACKVIEEQTLWGQTVCRVWLPNQDAVVRVLQSDEESIQKMGNDFPGTCINIEINTEDKNSYSLKSELKSEEIF
jgi:hypothetical protein